MNLNQEVDKWVKKVTWLWLPFYALFHLIEDFGEKKK